MESIPKLDWGLYVRAMAPLFMRVGCALFANSGNTETGIAFLSLKMSLRLSCLLRGVDHPYFGIDIHQFLAIDYLEYPEIYRDRS